MDMAAIEEGGVEEFTVCQRAAEGTGRIGGERRVIEGHVVDEERLVSAKQVQGAVGSADEQAHGPVVCRDRSADDRNRTTAFRSECRAILSGDRSAVDENDPIILYGHRRAILPADNRAASDRNPTLAPDGQTRTLAWHSRAGRPAANRTAGDGDAAIFQNFQCDPVRPAGDGASGPEGEDCRAVDLNGVFVHPANTAAAGIGRDLVVHRVTVEDSVRTRAIHGHAVAAVKYQRLGVNAGCG